MKVLLLKGELRSELVCVGAMVLLQSEESERKLGTHKARVENLRPLKDEIDTQAQHAYTSSNL
ncbi:unnamed protein product [Sphenostylis stenocarpa]|uniref:Uncharacterized protein n=1 Tax=Sphenostylis stenocarpa TaxID=92480 RepID=A0AA86SL00_9FABA|nr:unnamed protein product [Sphenostylis stenocarpa]